MEKNEAGKRKKECQKGGVVILNQHHQDSLCEKRKLNQDLKQVKEDQGII